MDMKYKILLAGKNKTVIDDFFKHLDDNIVPMSTSLRWEDIMGHLKYFEPDAFCYCVANEQIEHISQMVSLKTQLEKQNIPFVLIGSGEDCADFTRQAAGIADLILKKPLRASTIEERLIKYIDELRNRERMIREEAERFAMEAALEAERAAMEAEKTRRRHVLVVDDDPTMLKTIKEQLHDKYDVATALNGKIALKFLEKKTTDVILLDYEMPIENGPVILERLRANEATKDIPVIFLTGVTESSKIMSVLAMKPQGYLLKPIEFEKLMATLDKVLMGEGV